MFRKGEGNEEKEIEQEGEENEDPVTLYTVHEKKCDKRNKRSHKKIDTMLMNINYYTDKHFHWLLYLRECNEYMGEPVSLESVLESIKYHNHQFNYINNYYIKYSFHISDTDGINLDDNTS